MLGQGYERMYLWRQDWKKNSQAPLIILYDREGVAEEHALGEVPSFLLSFLLSSTAVRSALIPEALLALFEPLSIYSSSVFAQINLLCVNSCLSVCCWRFHPHVGQRTWRVSLYPWIYGDQSNNGTWSGKNVPLITGFKQFGHVMQRYYFICCFILGFI